MSASVVLDLARRDNLTIRELYLKLAGPRGHLFVVGTPGRIADEMQAWFEGHGCDGFNLVLPELRERGLFREEYDGATLRDHLGLAWPEPTWAVSASRQAIGSGR